MDDSSGDGTWACFLSENTFLEECQHYSSSWSSDPSTLQTNIAVAVTILLMLIAIILVIRHQMAYFKARLTPCVGWRGKSSSKASRGTGIATVQ